MEQMEDEAEALGICTAEMLCQSFTTAACTMG
jgi:hypothetical protein